ncbi:endonuclease [Patiriisocius marinistellae]|uniref:Endonuclease n=1 Tax=Patiriisocius marinistellae TaxID=2494560 RepID=A0A5J4G2F2_9FLAO|nr:endonuclease/exonuclease/phosphatase family protein [Patiriisocius marinistellae]GEQ86351.1 endonuclease [Patiriisocius marinistellae]
MKILNRIKETSFKTYLQIFGVITVILTLFRFVAMDYWWIRVFDFPHLQLTILSIIAFLAYFIKFDFKDRNDYAFATLMLLCMSYQIYKIYIYTPLASFEMHDAENNDVSRQLSFFTANVLQKNDSYKKLFNEIKKYDADLIVFTETDTVWQNQIIKNLDESYIYKVEVPLSNTYGMLLYSKLELINPQIKYQVDDSIPSIHSKIKLPSGDIIQLYAIHPTPPMPQHNPMSTDRDKEMMLTAKLALENKLPTLVVGDFNDVAWSQTSQLFQRVSKLLDPRKGRGLYNTFNSKNFMMRWPLDHVFASKEFRIISMERGDKIDSDHFPVYAKFSFEPDGASIQEPDEVSKKDLQRAEKQIKGTEKLPTDVY